MDDVSQNIRDDRHEQYRPTHSEVKEWAKQTLIDGQDPQRRGEEKVGPDIPGFSEVLYGVADICEANFTESEFRDLCREAFEEALDDVLDEEGVSLDEAVHRSLVEFDHDAARLTFSTDLIHGVLDGEKTATVRYDLEPDRLEPGSRVALVTSMNGRVFAEAYVADVIRTSLGDALPAIEDAGYQHNAETVGTLWRNMNGYYEDALELSTEVAVVLLDDIREVEI